LPNQSGVRGGPDPPGASAKLADRPQRTQGAVSAPDRPFPLPTKARRWNSANRPRRPEKTYRLEFSFGIITGLACRPRLGSTGHGRSPRVRTGVSQTILMSRSPTAPGGKFAPATRGSSLIGAVWLNSARPPKCLPHGASSTTPRRNERCPVDAKRGICFPSNGRRCFPRFPRPQSIFRWTPPQPPPGAPPKPDLTGPPT